MGLSDSATSTNLVAKLTPFGRQQLLANSSTVITHFAIGDSDAYYGVKDALQTGEVPDLAGNLGANSNSSNSLAEGYQPRSLVYVNSLGSKKKLVKEGSSNVVNSKALIGYNEITGGDITNHVINKADVETDSKVNLFYSLRLPITDADNTLFTVTTAAKGGFADTAYNALAVDEILLMEVPADQYSEMLDGKSVKVSFNTGVNTYTAYGTYQKSLTRLSKQDANYKETAFNAAAFGNNVAFLFSDDIQKPNNDATKSWATGHNKAKPFSLGSKELFNYQTDATTATVEDTIVGVAYLDKGLIAITDPTIVAELSGETSGMTGTSIAYNSVVTKVTQEVTCILDRGEFGGSANPTFTEGDTVRISEILLLDASGNIIAVAKPERHIEKTAQQFMALGIKITV